MKPLRSKSHATKNALERAEHERISHYYICEFCGHAMRPKRRSYRKRREPKEAK